MCAAELQVNIAAESRVVDAGSPLTLVCSVTPPRPGQLLSWKFYPRAGGVREVGRQPTLEVDNMQPQHQGIYRCDVTSARANGSAGITIEVRGITIEVRGISIEVRGITIEVRGISIEVRGITIEVRGITIEVRGISIEVRGITIEVRGITIEVRGRRIAITILPPFQPFHSRRSQGQFLGPRVLCVQE
jgi:hypothetical protein